jgi:hypothetical protein
MLKEQKITILVTITLFIFMGQLAVGDSISIGYHRESPVYIEYQSKHNEKITSEKRDGYKLNDWTERGSASVTNSPKIDDGIRLATWANRDNEEYDYGLASAKYLFDVPRRANSIKIKIQYKGDSGRYSDDDDSAGRLWIKSRNEDGGYEGESLYGDTFILRKDKHKEEITISSRDHVTDGTMEIHVIAEGGQLIDVDYIQVETYTSLPEVRVIARDYSDYISRPWYSHTYLYFYAGPIFRFNGDSYIRYTYNRDRHYIDIRRQYGSYLRDYSVRHPQIHIYWSGKEHFSGNNRNVWVDKWTSDHENARKTYIITEKSRKPDESRRFREQMRRIITEHRDSNLKHNEKRELREDKKDDSRKSPSRNIERDNSDNEDNDQENNDLNIYRGRYSKER